MLTLVAALSLAACTSGGSAAPTGPTTTVLLEANPLERGHGFVQLSGQRYDFEGVICATGPIESDPETSERTFGAYANFTMDGSLVAVSLTRYENHAKGAVPTVTDTALVRMQGDGEVLGLKAQRAQIIGNDAWGDIFDDKETGPLIIHSNDDRYDVAGSFGPTSGSHVADDLVVGAVAMQCPAKSAATTSTTPGATSTTEEASSSTAPATTNAAVDTTVPTP